MALTAGVGTPQYMSPEVLRGEQYGFAADCWSYGVLLWEIYTQARPDLWEQHARQPRGPLLSSLLKLLDEGLRLPTDATWPSWLSTMVEACLEQRPESRPSFITLEAQLRARVEEGQRMALANEHEEDDSSV
ncbi:uncharacterized protein MONBRDRAFT_16016 [Monosiga brevicollis MX1]|uniref:Protein kinase domain-containing protein n=1 Tax=Monosiga brevicollis TaxID=81824 RepID=A9UVX8_MONBE|nr:uncharacterized protein MONBRDRAFT_16016 [Monosiga brevicollis MX1]EDQ90666.1 predicted protein [Monosiga brevicollis MX1]|eukprot:XP_001744717.1 hypothetical protein [Monosiga brevicollis MX1]